MKKIICPTDFSSAANNAVEYAAKLAQNIDARLELVNVQLVSPTAPIMAAIEAGESEETTSATLKRMSQEVTQTFNVPCTYSLQTTSKTLEKAIASVSETGSLIVMGTNGTDDVYQYIFGNNTYHVVKQANCPVLMIPEGVSFRPINKIVFAWDYGRENKLSLLDLKGLVKIFDPKVILLHISQHKTPVGDELFKSLGDEILAASENRDNISFERIYEEDPEKFAEVIDDYMDESQADVLAIAFYDRGALKNIFHGKIAKDLTETARYPLLVLHA